ncbi:hypothetical protein F2Q69_00044236 [Brassica cretica]|uniref:Pentatricopeptide repeat-containing protein n=1 Tax=Brassica cretica TaxID=69181 RepID=A0A8S9NDG4_BRACR|nr:hypothetical protein F2Q69_00044236 [Brassica cretica]
MLLLHLFDEAPSDDPTTPIFSDSTQKESQPKLGLRFFNFLGLHRGFDHSTASFCVLIHALVKSNRGFSRALRQVKGKTHNALRLYHETTGGYCGEGDMAKTFVLQNEMMEKGIAPDTYTYRSLIHGQVEHLKPKSLWIAFTRRTMNSTRYEEDWRS